MEPQTAIEKLRILLPHWIEHNRRHEAEFRQWAAAARLEGSETLAVLLETAAANMVATDAILKKAGLEVGATGEVHDHAHPHDHG